jgi:1-acyl-sn-glycerol-3-phosphate acyltransferase
VNAPTGTSAGRPAERRPGLLRRVVATLHAVVVAVVLVTSTFFFGMSVIIAALLRIRDRPGSPYDWAPRGWGKVNLWITGVRVIEHDGDRKHGAQHIFVVNHVANYEILAVAAQLPWLKIVAKAELFRVPVLGPAMLAAGMIPIERQNRKSAFASYAVATQRIQSGASVAVFPEGTRGNAYPLRPFKKGPFVLAIQAQAPIVPVLVHGTLEVQRKGEFAVYPRAIHLHYLEPIPSTGMTYDDRDRLARAAYEAMAACLARTYGIESPPYGAA